ncbi:diamine acetyltransferase 2b isoform X1 [Oncorhynchus mykiss]|uniref:diamine acetyltransferase 2b isoform X1 n=1 Tax=Oncorhynchus mykiss TaxID=8022 RepID=UPI000B4EE0A5|nr:diamine acetyltransferase 2b isoform X1 [Oncorhynchus mykiss]
MHFKVRAAAKEDCKDISRMIMELAVYENMPDQVKTSHEDLERDGFSPNPFYECLIAEVPDEHKTKDGYTVVGYALYFYTYSTWKGRSVYMEDLYVMPDFRGKGIGTGLMAKVAQVGFMFHCMADPNWNSSIYLPCSLVGVEKQCVRLQLSVLDWNKPSLDFYIAKGAEDLTAKEGWHFLRFHGQTLDTLAKEAPKD